MKGDRGNGDKWARARGRSQEAATDRGRWPLTLELTDRWSGRDRRSGRDQRRQPCYKAVGTPALAAALTPIGSVMMSL